MIEEGSDLKVFLTPHPYTDFSGKVELTSLIYVSNDVQPKVNDFFCSKSQLKSYVLNTVLKLFQIDLAPTRVPLLSCRDDYISAGVVVCKDYTGCRTVGLPARLLGVGLLGCQLGYWVSDCWVAS